MTSSAFRRFGFTCNRLSGFKLHAELGRCLDELVCLLDQDPAFLVREYASAVSVLILRVGDPAKLHPPEVGRPTKPSGPQCFADAVDLDAVDRRWHVPVPRRLETLRYARSRLTQPPIT